MTRFVHLTDIHFSDPAAQDPQLYSDTAARLEHVKGMIARLDPAPAFVAVSGDLTNHGDPESYALLAQALGEIEVPLVLALGNHDARPAFRAAFGEAAEDPEAPHFHHVRLGDVHVIALDSLVPGRVGGEIGAAQFALLTEALGAHPDCRKLLLCHHPPHSGRADLMAWESLDAEESARLAEMLRAHAVAAILCGHVHADRVVHWHGIPVVISTGLHNSINAVESPDTVFDDGAGFAICDLLPAGLEVTFVPVAPDRAELGRIPHETIVTFR